MIILHFRSIMSSIGSGSSTLEFLIAFSVQSRASWSEILVNSDFTSKDTSFWPSGICIVLMASIKFTSPFLVCTALMASIKLMSPFLVARLCSVSCVLRFPPVSPISVARQSQHLILYTAPCLSSGLSLSLTLVISSRRKVVIGLLATLTL